MFTCQLFNALSRVSNTNAGSDNLLTLLTTYTNLVTEDVKRELQFLFDVSFTDSFKIETGANLSITGFNYNLRVNEIFRNTREMSVTYNEVTYEAVYEEFVNFTAIICEGEVIAVFCSNILK